MNRADKMLAVLSDGMPHTRHEIFNQSGCFFLTNNAASELRARGFAVEQYRDGDDFLYQLGREPHGGRPQPPSAYDANSEPSRPEPYGHAHDLAAILARADMRRQVEADEQLQMEVA